MLKKIISSQFFPHAGKIKLTRESVGTSSMEKVRGTGVQKKVFRKGPMTGMHCMSINMVCGQGHASCSDLI